MIMEVLVLAKQTPYGCMIGQHTQRLEKVLMHFALKPCNHVVNYKESFEMWNAPLNLKLITLYDVQIPDMYGVLKVSKLNRDSSTYLVQRLTLWIQFEVS